MTSTGYTVVEAPRVDTRARQRPGKSDPLDGAAIAATVLALHVDQLRTPREDDCIRAAMQILLTARDGLASERTRAVNAVTALLRIIDLGIDARRPLSATKIAEAAHWRVREERLAAATARAEATRLAKRILQLDTELTANASRIKELVESSPAVELLTHTGIGPVTAVTTLVAWSHRGRIKSEAAFASIAGVSPIPASSGNTAGIASIEAVTGSSTVL